jgi:hypothetical protein
MIIIKNNCKFEKYAELNVKIFLQYQQNKHKSVRGNQLFIIISCKMQILLANVFYSFLRHV